MVLFHGSLPLIEQKKCALCCCNEMDLWPNILFTLLALLLFMLLSQDTLPQLSLPSLFTLPDLLKPGVSILIILSLTYNTFFKLAYSEMCVSCCIVNKHGGQKKIQKNKQVCEECTRQQDRRSIVFYRFTCQFDDSLMSLQFHRENLSFSKAMEKKHCCKGSGDFIQTARG